MFAFKYYYGKVKYCFVLWTDHDSTVFFNDCTITDTNQHGIQLTLTAKDVA